MSSRAPSLIFWSSSALIAAETLLFGLVVPALPDFADTLSLSDSEAAVIFALFPIGGLLSSIVGAAMVEALGRRPVMLISIVVMSTATVGFAYSEVVALFALSRFMQGAATGLAWTAALAAISDVFPASELGYRMSLAEAVGGAGGGLAGPAVGGIAIELIGVRPTFLIAAVIPLVVGIPVLLSPETGQRGTAPSVPRLAALRRIMREPRARVASGALVGFAMVIGLVEPLLPLDLDRRLGLSAAAIGLIFGTLIICHLLTAPIAGRWSDRRGRSAPIAFGGVIIAVALPLTALGPPAMVAAAVVLLGIGLGGLRRRHRCPHDRGRRRGGVRGAVRAQRRGDERDLLGRRAPRAGPRRRGPDAAALSGDGCDPLRHHHRGDDLDGARACRDTGGPRVGTPDRSWTYILVPWPMNSSGASRPTPGATGSCPPAGGCWRWSPAAPTPCAFWGCWPASTDRNWSASSASTTACDPSPSTRPTSSAGRRP